jgi:hypothetical protein
MQRLIYQLPKPRPDGQTVLSLTPLAFEPYIPVLAGDLSLRRFAFLEGSRPPFTRKNGRQYRYYVSKSELRFGAAAKTYERIPANEVEAATVA